MNLKQAALPIVLATALLSAQLPGAPRHVHAAQQDLPPLSYVCPMPADAEVLETKPGRCPICGMDLIPVRIDSAWSCPNHAAVIRDKAGQCPIDKRELVPVVVAKHWSCAEKPTEYLGDPGKCADGSERKLVTELRAHGDHNPRHGGSFFMAEDKWHHLEGTYPSAGLFRAFFYDNFTKPLSPKEFSGSVVLDDNGKDGASFPLAVARNGQTLEARIKGLPSEVSKDKPVKVAAKIKFDAKTAEQRFDFTFAEFSKEPPAAPVANTTRNTAPTAKPAATTAPAATAAAPPPAPAAAPVAAAAPAAPTPPAETMPAGLSQTATAATMSRTDAELLASNLPNSPAELLKLLEQRTQEVNQAIQDGQFGYVYIPTMLSKDIALAIDDHIGELPDARRAQASSAVRRLVLASWELDLYGDLGNKEKINDAYHSFAAAFADIKAAYGASR
jgi:heavy metal-binding protein